MERIVRMSEAEYDRFCEFRGTEKTVRSMHAQMDIQRAEHEELAPAADEGFYMFHCSGEIDVREQKKAAQALRLAAEILM